MNATAAPPTDATGTDRIRVLHVDDDRAFADLTAEILAREDDIEVLTATDGRTGLDRFHDADIDCIVSDFEMPDVDGLELLEAIRSEDRELPFVLFTGRGSEAVASRALAAGASDYLRKQSGTEQFHVLANRIRNLVGRYRAARTVTRQAQAMEAATDGIAIVDEAGRYADANNAYTELFGTTRAALVGQHWTATVADDQVVHLRETVGPAMRADGEWTGVVQGRRTDGATFPMRVSLGRLDGGGHVCVARDLSDRRDRERRLRDERSRRETLFENATDPIVEVRLEDDAVIEAVNEPFEATFGVTDVADRTIADTIVPDHDAGGHEAILDRVKAGEAVRTEVHRQTTDGVRDFLLRVDPVERANGSTTAYGRYVDITPQRDRERDIAAEHAFVDQALDVLQDVFYVVDTDGTMRRWNDRLLEVTGYDDETIADMDAIEFFPDAHRDEVREAIADVLADGEGSVEAPIRTADGGVIPYEFTGNRLTDPDGTVRGLVGTGRDISHRRRYEQSLSALHSTTTRFMDATDRETVLEHAVETARRVLEMPVCTVWLHDADADELRPAAWTDDADRLIDDIPSYGPGEGLSWRAFETGRMFVYDDLQSEPDRYNPETPIESEIILPLGDHGVLNIGSPDAEAFDYMDVSLARILANVLTAALERVEREAELRAQRAELASQNRRLEEFASILSHDLRTPLTVATGRLELLMETTDDPGDAATALDALDRMEALIEDVLALARDGDIVTDPEAVSLAAVAEACWTTVGTEHATLTLDGDVEFRADDSRLRQLLENLLRNSVEHGGSDVSVTVGALPDGFFVADDGPGIPEEDREAVLDYGHSTDADGTGLGLRSVHRIVQAHGWELTITESATGGARIEITGVDLA